MKIMTKIRLFINKTYCLVVEFERLQMGGKRTKTRKKIIFSSKKEWLIIDEGKVVISIKLYCNFKTEENCTVEQL